MSDLMKPDILLPAKVDAFPLDAEKVAHARRAAQPHGQVFLKDMPQRSIRASSTTTSDEGWKPKGLDDLLRPIVRALMKRATAPGEEGVSFPGNLRELARDSGLSMLEAHHALHQLLDQRVVRLVDDCLIANDVETLAACLDPEN